MSKKKPLPPELAHECQALQAIYLAKKNSLKLSLGKIAAEAGKSTPAISHYLNGVNALNLPIAVVFSRLLDEPISSFSERLAREADSVIAAGSARSVRTAASIDMEALEKLNGQATPRSLAILDRIENALIEGRISEKDMALLEQIADRFGRHQDRTPRSSEKDYAALQKKLDEQH